MLSTQHVTQNLMSSGRSVVSSDRVSLVSNVQRVLMLTDSDQIRSSAKSVVAVCKVYCVRAG